MGKIIGALVVVGMLISIAVGWVLNLLALINMEVWVWSAKTIIGIGGVFIVPVGSIMGLFVW